MDLEHCWSLFSTKQDLFPVGQQTVHEFICSIYLDGLDQQTGKPISFHKLCRATKLNLAMELILFTQHYFLLTRTMELTSLWLACWFRAGQLLNPPTQGYQQTK
jgi:hypothetical protein